MDVVVSDPGGGYGIPDEEETGRVAESVPPVLEDTGNSEESTLVPGGG